MRAHVLQHVEFEGLGAIEDWLAARGASVTTTPLFRDSRLPPLDDLDLIIALGGPMSVNDEAQLPWLADEKRFLAAAMASRRAVLGICLGAQLMAHALGARVQRAREAEIGWFEIEGVDEPASASSIPSAGGAAGAPFRLPRRATVFHWHGETFELPPGSTLLARSAACAHQAFQYGPRAIGLQFHVEVTTDGVEGMIAAGREELIPARFVQSEAELRKTGECHLAPLHGLMNGVLEYLTRSPSEG